MWLDLFRLYQYVWFYIYPWPVTTLQLYIGEPVVFHQGAALSIQIIHSHSPQPTYTFFTWLGDISFHSIQH